VEAERFLMLTDVDRVYLDYGTPSAQRALENISAEEAERFLREGHFLKGSMEPKIQAAIRFARWSGRDAVIGSLDRAL
jgi:carbamate kinase